MRARFALARAALAIALLTATAVALPEREGRAASDASDTDGGATSAFEQANAAFAEGRFAEAADGFAAIAARDGASAALLFNLGNASFRAGRIGDAVLAYEQGLVLAPRSSAIAANLRQVRVAANLPPDDAGIAGAVVGRLSADAWAWLASACFASACVAFAVARLLRGTGGPPVDPNAAARALRAATVVLAFGAALAAGATCQALRDLDRAVVVGDDLALRVAPFASATASSPVATGAIVVRERLHEGYALVRTADGRSGWLPADRVRRVGDLPAPARSPAA